MRSKTFQDFGIDVDPSKRGEVDALCPKCSHTRRPENRRHKCLSVNTDKGTWNCFNCQWKGGLPKEKDWRKVYPMEYRKPKLVDEGRTDSAEMFLRKRGISRAVADRNGVVSSESQLLFPFMRGGELVTVKSRGIDDKKFSLSKDSEKIPMGWDDAYGQPVVVIVEGELDKLAIEEATGWEYVVSPPNGANPSDQVFAYLVEICDHATKVILAGDMDDPGKAFMAELASRIGYDRCYQVSWPGKDANDCLLDQGNRAVRDCLNDARPFPVAGVISMDDIAGELRQLYEDGMPGGDSTGWKNLDRHYTVRPGEITTVIGSPGSGKSVWMDALLINLARNEGWKFGVCSPEFQPTHRHGAHLIANYVGKPFGDGPTPRMDEDEMEFARKWLANHFWFVAPEETTIESVLSLAKFLVRRHGIKGFVLDPWNDLDHTRAGGVSETEFIHAALREIRAFARNHGVHFWIVVHPTKLAKLPNGKYPPPTLYDANGSAGFFNKTDNGLSVWRDYSDPGAPVELRIQKIKFHEVGGLGMVCFRYDRLTGRYTEAACPE